MRYLAVILLCLVSFPVSAKQSPYPPITQFNGDRYIAQAQMGADVARSVQAKRHKARHAARQKRQRAPIPVPRSRPGTVRDYTPAIVHGDFETPAVADGPRREVAGVIGAIARPMRFIGGRLICARNVNAALAERGIKGTGSALAKSFLGWGRPSGPVPGAIAVYNRGRSAHSGHVAIIALVKGGVPYVWNPSRHGWRLQAYHKRAIAYRLPS